MAILPGGIPSAEAHGSSKAKGVIRSWKPTNWRLEEAEEPRPIISPEGIDTVEAFGNVRFAYKIKNVGAIASLAAFGSHSIHIVSDNIIYAASATRADVAAAIASTSNGDTVIIPDGDETWASGITMPTNRMIAVEGSGVGNTIIRCNALTTIFTLGNIGHTIGNIEVHWGVIHVGGSQGFRIHNCLFTVANPQKYAAVDGYMNEADAPNLHWGVVDNCEFWNCRVDTEGSTGLALSSSHPTWSGQCILWNVDAPLGTNSCVYVENCVFDRDVMGNACDANYGGRYVFRHNVCTSTNTEVHGVQGNYRGTRTWEVYENVFTAGPAGSWTASNYKGGSGVCFNNIMVGFGEPITVQCRRDTETFGVCLTCDGTTDYWDQNTPGEEGWRCRDQVGTGKDTVLWVGGANTQTALPAYFWNNRDGNDAIISPTIHLPGAFDHIQSDRDYYTEASPFTGASGVGVGLLANRPSSGLTVGVGYWATDTKTLYKATGATTWETYYTPYTFPHPLRGVTQEYLLIDHTKTAITGVPDYWIKLAKANLHIAYGHTSHGQQIIEGMDGLVTAYGSKYAHNLTGAGGALHMENYNFNFGLGHGVTHDADSIGQPTRQDWYQATREFLEDPENHDINVIMWGWCTTNSTTSDEANIRVYYLEQMNQLELDYPHIKFVYWTPPSIGQMWGISDTQWIHAQYRTAKQIRDYCIANNKILYDYQDIESYDPDGVWYGDKYVHYAGYWDKNGDDVVDYTTASPSESMVPPERDANFMLKWMDNNPGQWYQCTGLSHCVSVSENMKANAAWHLFARLAGWDGT